MDKRREFKNFEFEGRKFGIGRFDPMTGSYIAYKLMDEVIPMLGNLHADLGVPAPTSGKSMSKADFFELQTDCLKVCRELLPAGPADVIDKAGNYGIQDFTPKLAIALTFQALVWNMMDFFDENLLNSLGEAMSGLISFLPKPQT